MNTAGFNFRAATRAALGTTEIAEKLEATAALWAVWQQNPPAHTEPFGLPVETAGIPARPVLADPRDMPRRQLSNAENHAALIHALAHIEFNAINLGKR